MKLTDLHRYGNLKGYAGAQRMVGVLRSLLGKRLKHDRDHYEKLFHTHIEVFYEWGTDDVVLRVELPAGHRIFELRDLHDEQQLTALVVAIMLAEKK